MENMYGNCWVVWGKKAYIQKVLSLDVEKHISQADIEAKETERIAKEKASD